MNNGASLPKACQCLGLTDRTFRNWRKQITEGKELKDGRQDRSNFKPRNALSEEERKTLIERLTRPDVVDLSYAQAFWTLLDKGEYYGSLSTIYRVMKDAGLNARRDGTRQGVKRHKPTSFEATGPIKYHLSPGRTLQREVLLRLCHRGRLQPPCRVRQGLRRGQR